METINSTSNIQKPECLIFDMDGTLWDATESYAITWNECNKTFGLETHITGSELKQYMGKPIDLIFHGLFPNSQITDIPKYLVTLDEIVDKMMPTLGGKLFSGVKEGIINLSKKYPLLMVSNCGAQGALTFMDFTGLRPYFTDQLTFGATRLNKTENIKLLMKKYGFNNGYYIGDTQHDCDETHDAGLKFGFMKYGFGTCIDADVEFENFDELELFFK